MRYAAPPCFFLPLMVSALFLLPVGASAQVLVDFDGDVVFDGGFVTGISTVPELSISGAILATPGSPTEAFNGNSTGSGAGGIDDANSGATISTPSGSGSTVSIRFSRPVSNLTFDAIDIDTTASFLETLTARVYDAPVGGNLLQTIVIQPGDPGTGDGTLAPVDFSSGFVGTDAIQRLEFNGVNTGLATAGYAVDNLSFAFTPVPVVPGVGAIGAFLLAAAMATVAVSELTRPRRGSA